MPFTDVQLSRAARGATIDAAAVSETDRSDAVQGVCGLVLAGSYHWGDTTFERVFRGPLLPVAQVPIICYPLGWLRNGGVIDARVCANSATVAVRDFLGAGESLGLKLGYYEDHTPRGPAGCARDAALTSDSHTFVVVEGSLIPTLDLADLLEAHRSSNAAATVVVETDRRQREVEGSEMRLPGGIYVLSRRVLESVGPTGFQDIKEGLLERLYKSGEIVKTYELAGVSARVLDYSTYTSANRWLTARAVEHQTYLRNYRRVGDALVHPTSLVHPNARMVGPVIVGPGVVVSDHALIVGPTTIGMGSTVGAGALVSRSVVWSNCSIGANAVVDCTLLADNCSVEPNQQLFGAVHIAPAERPAPKVRAAQPETPNIPIPETVWSRPAVASRDVMGSPVFGHQRSPI